jgi:serine/threonine-protein kinase PRP4
VNTKLKSPKDSYTVKGELGQGVFSTVLLGVCDSAPQTEVACKVLRNNELMRRAGEKEMEILKEIGPQPHCAPDRLV